MLLQDPPAGQSGQGAHKEEVTAFTHFYLKNNNFNDIQPEGILFAQRQHVEVNNEDNNDDNRL